MGYAARRNEVLRMEEGKKGLCGTCKYFSALHTQCRIAHPSVFPMMRGTGQVGFAGAFPPVTKNDWCGEHEPELVTQ